ncbi:HNH endonuclease signature motif containing protein [Xanthomonas citri]|uniref:HNH endonuclease signature motif containing protein n=1 Tax=Xanthomonas citri TaxID=346 RepID=UPI0001CED38C|nr:HNH endonuclease signature motif containing protein [Xanthomonas citri]EFF47878.1 hypothetical protein XAUC_17320 [Xanthomonas citri pv. aurantifolii str. ICPB 10535]AMV00047.1 hypothetical protein TP37_19675 [Xanthomonas citri pv. aurantifolii]AMV02125.1 hypothetical protein TP50_06460 [Xanthomonas citri pv. aurantifolii]TBW92939.1 hypothetical protein TP49_23550 [Xanthomonas citri pv. aurantifolii]TBX01157.1 hypothetical protein TP47_00990 [Xanthomonas citri pv. aurantifolii]
MLTATRLREVVSYDPSTGVFVRVVRLAQRHAAGDRADFLVSSGKLAGYSRISIDGRRYLAHRCAWLYVHGSWPEHQIDHVNGLKSDNRIANLRDVTCAVNRENMRVRRRDNRSGMLGVHLHTQSQKWRARLQVDGRIVDGGVHETATQAHERYKALKRELHQGCTI